MTSNGGLETRKLQVVGGSTFAVTLPKPWVDALGLAPGDELTIEVRPDGSILVAPLAPGRTALRRHVVDAGSLPPEALLRLIIACYAAGTDVLELRTKGPLPQSVRSTVNEACDRLRGLQLVEEGPNGAVLQDLADPRDLSMKKGLRMMHLNVRRMLRGADELLSPGDDAPRIAAELDRCEAEVDRLLLLLVKQHNRLLRDLTFTERTGVTVEESLTYMFAAQYLERVGDYAHRVATEAQEMGPQERVGILAARLHKALREASRLVDEAVHAFERNDAERANRVADAVGDFAHQTRERALELLEMPRKPAMLPARRLFLGYFSVMESTERIALYAKSIAEAAINKAIGTDSLRAEM